MTDPNVPNDHRWTWFPDGQETRLQKVMLKTLPQTRTSSTKRWLPPFQQIGGRDAVDMAVFLIQALWELEYK